MVGATDGSEVQVCYGSSVSDEPKEDVVVDEAICIGCLCLVPLVEWLENDHACADCAERMNAVAEKAGVFRCRLCGNVWRVA